MANSVDTHNVVYNNLHIDAQTMGLATKLNALHSNKPQETIMVCALPNGYRFFSDVLKYIAFNVRTDFCNVSPNVVGDWYSIHRFSHTGWYDDLPSKNRIYIFTDILESDSKCKDIADYYSFNFQPQEIHLCVMINTVIDGMGVDEAAQYMYDTYSHIYTDVHQLFKLPIGKYCGNGMPDSDGGYSTPPTIYSV